MNLNASIDHPQSLDQQILLPFKNVGPSEMHNIHPAFENIRNNCKYYCIPPTDLASNLSNQTPKCLSMIHVNARSLLSNDKFAEFELFLEQTKCNWEIICVSETWLSKDMEGKRHLPGYLGYFDSRDGGVGGGVAIYVKNDVIQKIQVLPKVISCTESLAIICQLKCNFSFILCQIYKPPNLTNNIFLENLNQFLEEMETQKKTIFMCGDFNIDLLNYWHNGAASEFFNILASACLFPIISKPTRVQDSSASLIDNIFTNNLSIIERNGIIIDDTTDHFPIFAVANIDVGIQKAKNNQEPVKQFNYHKIPELINHLVQALADFENITDPEIACNTLIMAYSSGIQKYSSHFRQTRKNTSIKPWITPAILSSVQNRCKLFKVKLKSPTLENKNKYNKYRNVLNTIIRIAKQKYVQDELEKNKDNTRRMWDTLLKYTVGKVNHDHFPNSFHHENRYIENKMEIAESFNSFFTSIGKEVQQDANQNPGNFSAFIGESCNNITSKIQPTNGEELISIIKSMKNVGSGFDNINARIFKLTYTSILNALVHLINVCICQGTFPKPFKIAIIKPVHKAGDKTLLNNYRPISILPYLSKILEKIIYIRLMTHFNDNNILCDNQFGFRNGHSTYMPILLLQDQVTKGFEQNLISCGIFLDLKKAFDTVDHDILCKKIQAYGITGNFLSMIHSYLSDRYQCVKFKDNISSLKEVSVGVPQGSILGPLLFIIFINDFPYISNKFTPLLYADDTTLVFQAKSSSELQSKLNEELPKICKWLQANKLCLNTNKTYYQIFNNTKSDVKLEIRMNETIIRETQTVKYLGILIDNDLKWNTHISHVSNIVSRNIGIISRSRHFLTEKHRYLLYNALIFPYLNYCCCVWGNSSKTSLTRLYNLQKKIVRIIADQPRLAHTGPIFAKLNILKLEDIAKHQIISIMHNVISQNAPSTISSLFFPAPPAIRETRVLKHFSELFTRKQYRTNTISWIGPRIWNSMIAPLLPHIRTEPVSKKVIKHTAKYLILAEYD